MRPSLLSRTACLLLAVTACAPRDDTAQQVTTVFAAGSLARPLRAALDTIAASGGPSVRLEIMGSREMLRAVTSLGRTPDLLVTADAEELERTLIPAYVTSSVTFARNRVVLALSPRLAGRDSITAANWADVVSRGGLRVARTDPGRAPLGYRTMLVWALAGIELKRPGLADSLAAASPASLLRGNESDLAALLTSGDADAAWCYESLARALRIPYIRVGDRLDMGSENDSISYLRASVRIPGASPGDTLTVRGQPIRYGIAVMTNAVDVVGATVLRERLLDSVSRRIMRRSGLDVLETPSVTTPGTALQLKQ